MDYLIIQAISTIIIVAIVIIANYFIKKDSKKIKDNLPVAKDIALEVSKSLSEASKIDNTIFPNSLSSKALQDISTLIEEEIKNINSKNISTSSGQVEICKTLHKNLTNYIKELEKPKAVG